MIAVLTIVHPQRTYLERTLQGIDESATSAHKVVVVDGQYPPDVPAGWSVELAPKPSFAAPTENKHTTWRAFELAVEAGEDLVFFEDDLLFCKNAVRYIETFQVPSDCAFTLFYAPWGDASMRGTWRIHAARYDFAQALKVPLDTCKTLVSLKSTMITSRLGGSDENLRILGTPRGWKIGVHYPGLVQHVGDFSAASQGLLRGSRCSQAWAGPAFDALTLDHRQYV